jgi:hypothetical protein
MMFRHLQRRRLAAFLIIFHIFSGNWLVASEIPAQNRNLVRLTPEALFKRVSPSVFVVEVLDLQGNAIALGSGVAVGNNLVVTNQHVIDGGVSLRVSQGDRQWIAVEKSPHSTQDLTLLSVSKLNAAEVTIRDGEPHIGERAYAIGSPEGLELTVSDGLISGIRELMPGKVSIQTTAAISHGSSGGGLFDEYGRLVGITTFMLKDGQNLNFAIPASFVRDLVHPAAPVQAKLPDEAVRLEKEWEIVAKQVGNDSPEEEIERARNLAHKLLEFVPDHTGVLDALGDIYYHKKDSLNAIKYYQQSLSVDPANEVSWSKLSMSFSRLKRYQEAIDAALHSIRLNPSDDSYAWANLGFAYIGIGDLTNALAAYQKETSLNPDSVDSLTDLALTHKRLGQMESFLAVVERIKSLDPARAQRLTAPSITSPQRPR